MAGRKTIEIDYDKVEQLAAQGLTERQIAESMGISRATVQRRKANDAAFEAAIKAGAARGLEAVTNALWENATQKGNVAAAIFYLKNRGGWTDKAQVEAQHSGEVVVEHDVAAALEALKRAGIDPASL